VVEVDLLEKAYVHLKGFHQVNMILQKEAAVSFIEVKEIFEIVLHDYPELGSRLATNFSFVQKVEYHRKRKKTNHEYIVSSKYVNLDVLCGTLVECERLFLVAKNILTDTRKGTSPAVFQALLLLKVNQKERPV
jgi:hypothetical protein